MSQAASQSKTEELTKKDLVPDQTVRWCPGCGDYMILATMQKTLPKLGIPREKFVFVSGIGCSSRFPYYMETYGFHTLHGRAPAVATGVKLANPELNVWTITGDGDCLAIGGNHFIHTVRRDIDINILVFNNKVYALTKGQSSPTTPPGTKTSSTPDGAIEHPFSIGEMTIGANGTFFARVPDNDPKLMEKVMLRGAAHKGTSVVEILQNCVIFTDGIHNEVTGKDKKHSNQVVLRDGEPAVFGPEKEYGIKVNDMQLDVVENDDETEVIKHNPSRNDTNLHYALAKMKLPDYPLAMGVIREVQNIPYNEILHNRIQKAKSQSKYNNVEELINSGRVWNIE